MLKNCLVILFLFLTTNVLAQKTDSIATTDCRPLKELISEASYGFKKVTGRFIGISNNDSLFEAKAQFPGTLASVMQNRSIYVGDLYDGFSSKQFDTVYVNTLNMLYDCLSPDEYEVFHIRESGNAQAKNYPDIEFRPREDTSHTSEAITPKTVASSKTGKPIKPAGPAKPLPASVVKKPVNIYMKANGKTSPGTYKLEILIHPI